MYISEKVLSKAEPIFSKGVYRVIANTIKQDYTKENVSKEETYPNYLIVNTKTRAIEFGVDQLPSAYEIATKLSEEAEKFLPKKMSLVKDTIQ